MKKRLDVGVFMPFIIFMVITLFAGVLTGGQVFSPGNLMSIINQSVPYFLAGLGRLFVAAMGGTDITCGSLIGLSAAAGAYTALTFGTWLMFPAAMLVGAFVGLLNGIIISKFKVPSFMCTLAMLLAIRALVNWLLSSRVFLCSDEMLIFDELGIKLAILVLLFVIFGFIFRFTPFGEYIRSIGENEQAMEYTGISVSKVKICAYMVSGLLAGIAGIFALVRLGGASNTMGSGVEMKVMLCMFLAGIPVSGGMGSRIYKLVIGVLTYFMLDNGLTLLGGNSNVNQLIRGIFLILALIITRIVVEKNEARNIKLAGAKEL